jgi:alkylation response protein AidB-like acyl-CoA dehydrogenase
MSAALLAGDIAAPLDHARRLADQFAATAAELDTTGAFPAANFTALHEAGIVNLVTAQQDGGGLALAHRVVGEIARGSHRPR